MNIEIVVALHWHFLCVLKWQALKKDNSEFSDIGMIMKKYNFFHYSYLFLL